MACTKDEIMCDWSTIFPDFSTIEGSKLFIKKIVAVSLSAITYYRGVFPERAYGERKIGGIKVKVLTEDSGLESVSSFIELIRSCYDAVDKKYLQQMKIGICRDPKNKNEVIESYCLTFRYSDKENSITCNKKKVSSLTSDDPTVQATLMMLKHIHSVNEILEDLPKNSFLTVKLLYYDDVTPPDYEPEGFEPSTCEKFTFPGKALKLSIGTVETQMSGCKLHLKSVLVSNPKFAEEAILLHTQEQNKQKMITGPEYEEESISTPETASDLIKCMICKQDQHKICYGILNDEDIPEQFYCVYCFTFEATDTQAPDIIYSSRPKDQQNLCAMRRAIYFASKLPSVSQCTFEKELGFNKLRAKTLMEQLISEDIVTKMNRNKKHQVNEEKLKIGMIKYFPNHENKENMDQTTVRKQNKRNTSRLQKLSMKSTPEEQQPSDEDEEEISNEEVEALEIDEPEEKQYNQRKRKSFQDEPNDSVEPQPGRAIVLELTFILCNIKKSQS
ncbi:HORMA domain-containing protein 1-like [Uloborus diversus]|uniref:HORMA domain-containing protein 1-like n=1 Tax=Uloborus diversus TaxID=327109 RepID=UPI00240A847F|nr:HORMA domain-containing protein 1-like [Uloborus diversus]